MLGGESSKTWASSLLWKGQDVEEFILELDRAGKQALSFSEKAKDQNYDIKEKQ